MTVFELGFKVWVRYDLVENANLENQDSRSKTNKIMEMKMSVIGKKTGKQAAAWKTGFCLFVNRSVVPDSLQPTVAHQAPWKESYDQPRQHSKKQRYYFANKRPSS